MCAHLRKQAPRVAYRRHGRYPACLIIGILSVVPTLITKKFSRWQGVLMLAAYAVYIVLSVIVMA